MRNITKRLIDLIKQKIMMIFCGHLYQYEVNCGPPKTFTGSTALLEIKTYCSECSKQIKTEIRSAKLWKAQTNMNREKYVFYEVLSNGSIKRIKVTTN